MAGLALDFDPPAVIGDDSPRFRQAESQAAAGLAGGIERVEGVTPLLGLQPRSVVANVNSHLGGLEVCDHFDNDLDLAAVLQGFERVLAHRPQGDLQLHGIGLEEDRAGIAAAADGRLLAAVPRKIG